jgi:hypothetical protein
MIQEQNDSKHDLQNISFDTVYSNNNQIKSNTDNTKLLYNDTDTDNNCCDRLCIWWFFHSSLGINKYNYNPDDNTRECLCCNFCTWCCEFRFKSKCCIKEIGCCCITCSCE